MARKGRKRSGRRRRDPESPKKEKKHIERNLNGSTDFIVDARSRETE